MKYLDLRLAKELRKGIKISEGIRFLAYMIICIISILLMKINLFGEQVNNIVAILFNTLVKVILFILILCIITHIDMIIFNSKDLVIKTRRNVEILDKYIIDLDNRIGIIENIKEKINSYKNEDFELEKIEILKELNTLVSGIKTDAECRDILNRKKILRELESEKTKMIDAANYISRLQRFLVEHDYDKNKELMELIDRTMMENMLLRENNIEDIIGSEKSIWKE